MGDVGSDQPYFDEDSVRSPKKPDSQGINKRIKARLDRAMSAKKGDGRKGSTRARLRDKLRQKINEKQERQDKQTETISSEECQKKRRKKKSKHARVSSATNSTKVIGDGASIHDSANVGTGRNGKEYSHALCSLDGKLQVYKKKASELENYLAKLKSLSNQQNCYAAVVMEMSRRGALLKRVKSEMHPNASMGDLLRPLDARLVVRQNAYWLVYPPSLPSIAHVSEDNNDHIRSISSWQLNTADLVETIQERTKRTAVTLTGLIFVDVADGTVNGQIRATVTANLLDTIQQRAKRAAFRGLVFVEFADEVIDDQIRTTDTANLLDTIQQRAKRAAFRGLVFVEFADEVIDDQIRTTDTANLLDTIQQRAKKAAIRGLGSVQMDDMLKTGYKRKEDYSTIAFGILSSILDWLQSIRRRLSYLTTSVKIKQGQFL